MPAQSTTDSNVTPARTKRVGWIDIARGIGMLLIIEGHLGMPGRITNMAFSVHVPLFFLISGYLSKPGRPGAIAKYARRLLIPYVATGVTIAFIEAIKAFAHEGLRRGGAVLLEWLAATAFGSGSTPSPIFGIHQIGATWFLLALFFAMLINEFIDDKPYAWPVTIALLAFALISRRYWWLPWSIQPACMALTYVRIGREARLRGFDPSALGIIPVLGAAAIWMADIFYDRYTMNIVIAFFRCMPLDLAGSIAGAIVICWIASKLEAVEAIAKPLEFIGTYSMPILCFHLIELVCMPWWDIAAVFGLGVRRLTYLLFFIAKICWAFFWAFVCLHVPPLGKLYLGIVGKPAEKK